MGCKLHSHLFFFSSQGVMLCAPYMRPRVGLSPKCKLCAAGAGAAVTAAGKGVTTVAKVTWQVGTEAVKAAAPVGKWALQQGFKLAVTAVSKGIEGQSNKNGKGKKN